MTTARFFVPTNCNKAARLRARSRRGAAAMVETALCMGLIVLPVSIGIVQYGIVINASSQIELISREGGRFAAVHCLEPTFDGDENQASPPSLRYYLKNNVVKNRTTIAWTDINGAVQPGNGGTGNVSVGYIQVTPATAAARVAGQSVSVKVCYPMIRKIFTGKITPGIGTLDNDYNATSTFAVE